MVDLECHHDNYWYHKKCNEVSVLYENGHAFYHCEYVIGPFLLGMHLMHDFKKHITYINQFKLCILNVANLDNNMENVSNY